jgi:WD repeat-containing protein 19
MKNADNSSTALTRKIFELTPKQIGKDRPLVVMSKTGQRIAVGTVSTSGIWFFNKQGEEQNKFTLPSNSIPIAISFDSEDLLFSVMCKERIIIYKLSNLDSPFHIVECEGDPFVIHEWSAKSSTLAIGSVSGAITFFNQKTVKKTKILGKHSKKVSYLSWNANDLLLSVAEDKSVCVSKSSGVNEEVFNDILKMNIQEPEKAIWISTIFNSRVQKNLVTNEAGSNKNADDKKASSTPIQALSGSANEFGFALTTKAGKAISLVFPGAELSVTENVLNQSYGKVMDFTVSNRGDVVVATARGYLVKYAIKNGAMEESKAEKIFQNSIEFARFDLSKGLAIVLGDNLVRFIDFDTLKEIKDFRVTFEKNLGVFSGLIFNTRGNFLLVSTSSGYVFGISIRGESVSKLSMKYFATKVTYNQINVKTLSHELTVRSIDDLEKQPGFLISFPGSEISDFCFIRDKIYVSQEKIISCFSFDGHQAQFLWKKDLEKPIEKIFGSEKGRLLLVTSSSLCIINALRPNALMTSVDFKNTATAIIRYSHEFTSVLDGSSLFIYDNETLEAVISKTFKEQIANFFMNEKSLEFYLYVPTGRKLIFFSIDGKSTGDDIINLPDKSVMKNLIFDENEPNTFCIHFSSGKIYTIKKFTNHYKFSIIFKMIKEILSVEDLEEQKSNELAVTFLDADITPIRLKAGFLTCLERGTTVIGTYLASHSFMLGLLNTQHDSFEVESLANLEGSNNKPNMIPTQNGNQNINFKAQVSENEREYLIKSFVQLVELGNYQLALKSNYGLDSKKLWDILGRISLEHLDLSVATICYQRLENLSMSYYIRQLSNQQRSFDDLRCEISVILCDYDFAHSLYLETGKAEKAAELLCHLHEFQTASDLCKQHNLEKLELYLNLELADQALKNEEFIKAQSLYEELLQKVSSTLSRKRASANDKSSKNSRSNLEVKKKREDNCLINTDESVMHKRALFGLCSLFIRQGSTLRATQTLMQIETENREDIEELAELAKEFDQFSLSAELFAKIGQTNKEIEVCLQAFQISADTSKLSVDQFIGKVRSSLSKLTDPEVMLKVALFVQSKDHDMAESLLQKSGNVVEHVKFLLFVTKNIEKAESVFEKNKLSAQNAANYLAEYYSQSQDNSKTNQRKAIRYFLLSGRKIEAFKKAFESGNIEFYCECVEVFDQKEAIILARYFNVKNENSKAGKFYMIANEFEKALFSFIKANNFDEAIELVFKLNDDDLFEVMVQILAGEILLPEITDTDMPEVDFMSSNNGIDFILKDNGAVSSKQLQYDDNKALEPVDPIYLFKLYLRFNKIDQANTIALTIIDRELIDGSYKSAHQHAFLVFSQMIRINAKINSELRNKFIILQSYSIVKRALKYENHNLAALLLNRICCFIHYLPKSSAEIMTSAVIESTKAGYKLLAYTWALTLCKPQYRSLINQKYKEKIEKIALKPVTTKELSGEGNLNVGWIEGQSEKIGNGASRCPNCQSSSQDAFGLSCTSCLSNFVICMASGKAILGLHETELLTCKSCTGIGYKHEIFAFVRKDGICPMCEDRREITGFEVAKMETVKHMMIEQ